MASACYQQWMHTIMMADACVSIMEIVDAVFSPFQVSSGGNCDSWRLLASRLT